MIKYIEFSKLDSDKRDIIIKEEELSKYISPLEACYRSLFYFDVDFAEHTKKNGTIKGYNGKAGIDRLVFDFDHLDLEVSKAGATCLIDRLKTIFNLKESEIGIFFSGKKGFAIEVLTKGLVGFEEVSEKIPFYTKRCCLTLAEDIESFDRIIYNILRLYRIANTRHQKKSQLGGIETQLFKIPLTHQQFNSLSIEDIKRLATRPQIAYPVEPISNPDKLNLVFSQIKAEVDSQKVNVVSSENKQVLGQCPKSKKYCLWYLEQGLYTESRDNALLILATEDRKQGVPREVSRARLIGVLDLMNQNNPEKALVDPVSESDLDRIIKQAYNNEYNMGCNHPILSSVCGTQCYLYRAKQTASKSGVLNLLDAYNQSSEFFKNYYSNLIQTGFKIIDDNMPMFLGSTNLLVGLPGIGKTSLCLNIIKNAARLQTPIIFFNMDMSAEMTIAKLGSIILAEINGKPICSTKEFMEAHTKQIFNGRFHKAMEELSKWVWISSERHLSVKDMINELDFQEKTMGRKFKMMIVDHIQLLNSDARSEYEKHTRNAELLTELAKTRNICVLGLSHAVNNDFGLGLEAKGSRAWAAECSTQINCFRPFQHIRPDQDLTLTLQLAKNRLGVTDSLDLYYDGASGWIRELTPDEALEVAGLKEEIRQKSKKEK